MRRAALDEAGNLDGEYRLATRDLRETLIRWKGPVKRIRSRSKAAELLE